MARARLRNRRWRVAAVAGLAALLLSGCATVPDSGSVQRGRAAAAGGQGYLLQPVITPPGQNWSATQIVSGFLNATASLARSYAAARQYLNPAARRRWERSPGWAVDVIGPQVAVNQIQTRPQQEGPGGNTQATVQVVSQRLARVTHEGQYVASQGQSPYRWTFQLQQQRNGQWRITNPPSPPPLYDFDFHRLYLSRDLYFLAPGGRALVPDPILVPLQATSVDVAKSLVASLQAHLPGWLAGAATTALAGSRLLGNKVTINAGTATVDLGATAARASPAVLSQIMAQLVWTLASPSYGQSALVQSVELEIDGHMRKSASWSGGQPQVDGQPFLSMPQPPGHQVLYSVAGPGTIQEMTLPSFSATRVTLQGSVPLGPIAVSPGGRYVAAITGSGGTVSYGALKPGARLAAWSPAGGVTSVSWDPAGDLWVAGPRGVWMIRRGGRPVRLRGLPSGSVVQLQVAPDGVRVAMIVSGPAGNGLLLGAIVHHGAGDVALGPTVPVGTGVSDPAQLAWYDPDNLIVLSRSPGGPSLDEAPVNGGSPTPLIAAPGTKSIAAAGPGNPLAAALPGGSLTLAYTINGTWARGKAGAGQYPTYAATP